MTGGGESSCDICVHTRMYLRAWGTDTDGELILCRLPVEYPRYVILRNASSTGYGRKEVILELFATVERKTN